jgi:drug/metabolite transporter (DMT)-like permease
MMGAIRNALTGNAWLLLTLTSFSWGGNVVAGRLAVGEISPMVLICLRWALVSTALLLWRRERIAKDLKSLWPYRTRLFWLGALGITLPNALFYEAARFTTGVNVAIIQGVQPVLVLIGAFLVFRTGIGLVRLFGAAITIVGVLLIGTRGDLGNLAGLAFNAGDLLAFLGAIAATFYALALRNRPPVSAMALFVGIAIGAFLSSLPILALETSLGETIWPGLKGLLILLYVAVFTSVVGHATYMQALALIGAQRVTLILNLIPVVGAFLSVLILGETFALYHASALALVLIGIWMSERLGGR